MSTLPLHDIILFVDVVNFQSFTKAAHKHHLTPAAVSKRISSLEKFTGIRLFNRSTRKIALTESGEVLYQHCNKIHQDVESAHSAILDLHNTPQGVLTISSPTNFSNIVLAPIIAEFSGLYPNICVKVELTDIRKIPEIGGFDIAIRSGQLTSSNLIARKLTSIHFVYCASPEYIKENGSPAAPENLEQHKIIDYNYREEGSVWTFSKKNQQRTQKISPVISANNALFIKFVAIHGGGIACLPNFMISTELQNGQLISCFNNYFTLEQPIWVIHPYTDRYLPQKVKLFTDFIFKRMNPNNE
ncbi:MAG: LysR family transcriptional regulator [Gammaproteobacteria bacterium]|nr:LysR family transcriptional regulator [Gammaproteobacteria bacterium]